MKRTIRRFVPDDADAVRSLHLRALEGTGSSLGPGPWDDDLNDVEASYLATGGEFLVLTIDDAIVAMGAFRRVDADTAEIKRMRVEPHLQGRGIGKAVLSELHARASANGFQRLVLHTTSKQIAAQRLYESFGYRRTHTTQVQQFTVHQYERGAAFYTAE